MSKLEEKLAYFKAWQAEIMKLDAEVGPKLKAMQKEYDEKANEMTLKLNSEVAKYRAEFKVAFGLCDSEKTDPLTLIEAIKAVNQLL